MSVRLGCRDVCGVRLNDNDDENDDAHNDAANAINTKPAFLPGLIARRFVCFYRML